MTHDIAQPDAPANLPWRPLLRIAAQFTIFGLPALILSPTSGVLTYVLISYTMQLYVQFWLARHNPALYVDRDRQSGFGPLKSWLWVGVYAANVAPFCFEQWLPIKIVAGFMLWGSYFMMPLCFEANPCAWALSEVRAGQPIAVGGPYGFCRHPIYRLNLFIFVATAFLLNSPLGYLWAAFFIWETVQRAKKEDNLLRCSLPGYEAYAQTVRRML